MDITNALEVFNGAWPAVQPAISTVFGAVVATLFLRKNTATTEIEKIKQAKFSDIADTLLSEGHITHLEYYKCHNFTNIAKKADEIYRKKQKEKRNAEEASIAIDFDWFVRFFEDSGTISNEDMQDLWAKVFAGEIDNPGSFSRRTLNVLRNLSREDAQLYSKVAHYIFHGSTSLDPVLYNDTKLLKKHSVGLVDIFRLCDCELLSAKEASLSVPLFQNEKSIVFLTNNLICLAMPNTETSRLAFPIFRPTQAGTELLGVVKPTIYECENDLFIHDVVSAINSDRIYRKDATISLHKVNAISGNSVSYDDQLISLEGTADA